MAKLQLKEETVRLLSEEVGQVRVFDCERECVCVELFEPSTKCNSFTLDLSWHQNFTACAAAARPPVIGQGVSCVFVCRELQTYVW